MSNETEELGFLFKRKINTLAALFYRSEGRKFMSDYDFSCARHPKERGCWNKAIIAYAFINDNSGLLEHQVGGI